MASENGYCTSCGVPKIDGTSFCTSCGTPHGVVRPTLVDGATPTPAPSPNEKQSSKLVLGVMLILVLLIGGGLLVFQPWSGKQDAADSATTTEDVNRGVMATPPAGVFPAGDGWPVYNPPADENVCTAPFPLGEGILLRGESTSDPAAKKAITGVQLGLASLGYTQDGGNEPPYLVASGQFDQATIDAIGRYRDNEATTASGPTHRFTEQPSQVMIDSTLWASLGAWLKYRGQC